MVAASDDVAPSDAETDASASGRSGPPDQARAGGRHADDWTLPGRGSAPADAGSEPTPGESDPDASSGGDATTGDDAASDGDAPGASDAPEPGADVTNPSSPTDPQGHGAPATDETEVGKTADDDTMPGRGETSASGAEPPTAPEPEPRAGGAASAAHRGHTAALAAETTPAPGVAAPRTVSPMKLSMPVDAPEAPGTGRAGPPSMLMIHNLVGWSGSGPCSEEPTAEASTVPAAVTAVGVAAITPRVTTAVSVAMDFARLSGGWAGPLVFNVWLRRQLRERRMSQRQLGVISGVNHSTISRLLAGSRIPSLETAAKLVHALRLDWTEDQVATYFDLLPERTLFPTQRVESALRGDPDLEDADVLRIMDAYLVARSRRRAGNRADEGAGEGLGAYRAHQQSHGP